MEKASKELLKEFVNSQHFTSTTDIMNSMKDLFSDVLQTVIEAELEEKLGYEKSERASDNTEKGMSKNYRNGYSKKTVKTQLGEVDVKIPRDRNGEYEPQIIEKYNRNADGMEEKILALYSCGMILSILLYTIISKKTSFLEGAHCVMPLFYSVQNESGLLPDFGVCFHLRLLIFLVILPTAAFSLLSIAYGCLKMKTPVLGLLKGKSGSRAKKIEIKSDMPFLMELKKTTVKSRKSLVFFIAFASFCYSAMVQMSFGMGDLASEMMSVITLMIGVILAFTTMFIAVASVINSNADGISIMRVFGYSKRECSSSVLGGYRPAALAGFAVGTFYQYFLLKIAVEMIFRDIENVPDFDFNFRALIIAAVSFAVIYETIMFCYSRKIGKLSVKKIMLESE